MTDIFDNQILCKECKTVMSSVKLIKNGFVLRAMKCKKCGSIILHPIDKQEYDNFINLRKKEFSVKMRMVGNSYAVSIPREIVDFMKEQEKIIDDIVRLNFEDAGRLSLLFNTPELKKNSRMIKSREIKIVKNNKPVFHAKQYSDSANPKHNRIKIIKPKELEEDDR